MGCAKVNRPASGATGFLGPFLRQCSMLSMEASKHASRQVKGPIPAQCQPQKYWHGSYALPRGGSTLRKVGSAASCTHTYDTYVCMYISKLEAHRRLQSSANLLETFHITKHDIAPGWNILSVDGDICSPLCGCTSKQPLFPSHFRNLAS